MGRNEIFINDGFILEVRGVSKEFPGVKALDRVDLSVKKGEVHALIGENGAGKSTLIKILAGIYTKEEGEIIFDGNTVEITSPAVGDKGRISGAFIDSPYECCRKCVPRIFSSEEK